MREKPLDRTMENIKLFPLEEPHGIERPGDTTGRHAVKDRLFQTNRLVDLSEVPHVRTVSYSLQRELQLSRMRICLDRNNLDHLTGLI